LAVKSKDSRVLGNCVCRRGGKWGHAPLFFLLPAVMINLQIACSPQQQTKQNQSIEIEKTAASGGSGIVIEIDSKQQLSDIVDSGEICFVTFYSNQCEPCHFIEPMLFSLAKEYADSVMVCRLDGDRFYPLVKKYRVEAYPTVIIFNNGRQVKRLPGPRPKSKYVKVLDELIKPVR